MRKTEAPYKLRIVFGRSEEEGIEGFMRSWNWEMPAFSCFFYTRNGKTTRWQLSNFPSTTVLRLSHKDGLLPSL